MDAFYAAVEVREDPSLRGKPVVIGHRGRRGVVSTCSYEARRFGVRSAMPSVTAERLCPGAVWLPGRMALYVEVSHRIREILDGFSPLVEPLSIDEAFLDLTGIARDLADGRRIASEMKREIRDRERLTASAGVAPNKFLAKIASDLKKPDALVVVEPGQVQEFLDPLPVERLWGVGRQGSKVLQQLGIRTIGQLRGWPLEVLQSRLGSSGECLWQLAHGIDDRAVVPEREAKSISHETTFEQDIADMDVLRAWLLDLTEQVAWRLRRHKMRARTVHLKVRFADFSTITRSQTLWEATDITQELWQAADEMLSHRMPAGHLPVRLLGMGVSGIDDRGLAQGLLFDQEERQRQARIDAVTDLAKERFGAGAIRRGSGLERGENAD